MTAESDACIPAPFAVNGFNPKCLLPYGLSVGHVGQAMAEFLEFLGFINQQLHTKNLLRLESFLMPANFSSLVGEFMNLTIPNYCSGLVRNKYHNGHPDLIPADMFAGDSIQYAHEGIEIKASRHSSGWQGHNPEAIWLMVFNFDSNTSRDSRLGIPPKSFRFLGIYAAKLEESDWSFSGRSESSRQTITASVNRTGVEKMRSNPIYEDPLREER